MSLPLTGSAWSAARVAAQLLLVYTESKEQLLQGLSCLLAASDLLPGVACVFAAGCVLAWRAGVQECSMVDASTTLL